MELYYVTDKITKESRHIRSCSPKAALTEYFGIKNIAEKPVATNKQGTDPFWARFVVSGVTTRRNHHYNREGFVYNAKDGTDIKEA